MAVREIVLYGHPVLRLQTELIAKVDDTIRILADDMIETMYEADGIGLAGPQVGELLSICVVNAGLIKDGEEARVFINPVIYEDTGSCVIEEGCLSIPDIREDVVRPETIKVRYLDIEGGEHHELCDGMIARVLQHEVDHLSGVLFIDRISNIKRKLLEKKLKKIASQ